MTFGLLGLAFGSFLNVCIDRLPHGRSIISPPSQCKACHRRLAPRHLVPVLSYLWLRGRCGYCGASIPLRLTIVEVVTGLSFALLLGKFGFTMDLAILLVYTCLVILIFSIDLETQLILDWIVYPGMALALLFSLTHRAPDPGHALLGGVLGFGLLLALYLVFPRGIGLGDVKLSALAGLMTGYPLVFVALLLSFISGGAVATFLLVSRKRGRRDPIPFGPFLATAALVTVLWGDILWVWYSGAALFR